MERKLDLMTPRRSEAFWLALAVGVMLVLFALDAATAAQANLIGLFAVPPFIAAVGTGRRETAAVAVLVVVLALVSGVVDDFFGSFEHLVKVGLLILAGLLATHVAMIRERAEVSSRLDNAVARALAETGRLDNAGSRILPAIAQALEWDAAALWEVEGNTGTLRCTSIWRAPHGRLERFDELSAEFERGAGIGLPGRVLASGEPVWVQDIRQDETLPEAQTASAIGIRSAVAFPIIGEGGTRAVVNLFSRRRRPPDPELMKGMATAGRYIGQHLYRRRVEGAVRRAEALRGAVLESALDCVITMNHEGRIVEFNPAAERTFGYARADVVGKTVAETLVPEQLREDHRAGLARYLETGENRILGRRLELTGKRSDGTEFPIEVSIVRIGGEDPPIFAGYLRDLTARKLGEESTRRLAAIVEHSSDAVVGVGVDGRIVAWNPGAERLYGWSAKEAIGMAIADTAPPDRADEANYLVRQLMEGNAIANHRTVRQRKDGELVDVALTLSPIRDEAGEMVGMAGIIRDISDELEIERERVRLLEQETKARRRAEDLERRASFLVEIHTALDSSLDYEVVLRRLARITVPRLADWCVIHMDDGGTLRRLAVAHSDPKQERFAWDLEDRYPTDPNDTQGVPEVLRTGKAELYPEISDEMLEQSARDPEHLEITRGLGLRSAMLVPLRARGQTLGVVTMVSAESGRLYDQDDLDFASAMARRAALSIDNARLHSKLTKRSQENEFLAQASAELDQTLDLDETLQRVADLAVPSLGDGCMVDLLEETGIVRRVCERVFRRGGEGRARTPQGAAHRPRQRASDRDRAADGEPAASRRHRPPHARHVDLGRLLSRRGAGLAGSLRSRGAVGRTRPDARLDRIVLVHRPHVRRRRRPRASRARAPRLIRGRQCSPVRARAVTSPPGSQQSRASLAHLPEHPRRRDRRAPSPGGGDERRRRRLYDILGPRARRLGDHDRRTCAARADGGDGHVGRAPHAACDRDARRRRARRAAAHAEPGDARRGPDGVPVLHGGAGELQGGAASTVARCRAAVTLCRSC